MIRRPLTYPFAMGLLFCAFILSAPAQTFSDHFERGKAALDAENNDLAIAEFTRALAFDSSSAAAHNNRGTAHGRKGAMEAALADFERAIQLDPNSSTAYANRAVVRALNGQSEMAMADADLAIKLAPSDARSYSSLAVVYYAKQDYERAIAEANRALSIDPGHFEGYFARGVTYYAQKKYKAAESDFISALRIRPGNKVAVEMRDKSLSGYASPPAWFPMMGEVKAAAPAAAAPAAAAPAKCPKVSLYSPQKEVTSGEPGFFAAMVDGEYIHADDNNRFTWSFTAGRTSVDGQSTLALDTSKIYGPSLVTVTVEFVQPASFDVCRMPPSASGVLKIKPVPGGRVVGAFSFPLDEVESAAIWWEVKRINELLKAKVATEVASINIHPGPATTPAQAAAELASLRKYLIWQGVDLSTVRLAVLEKRDSFVVELRKGPPAAFVKAAPPTRRSKRQ